MRTTTRSKTKAVRAAGWLAAVLAALSGPMLRAQTVTQRGVPAPTYRAAFTVSCGGTGDCATISFGSEVVRVEQVTVSGASAQVVVSLIERTSADSGGTAGTAPTAVAMSSSDPPATATLADYTVAPTAGTAAGTIAIATVAAGGTFTQNFSTAGDQAPTLESAGQSLAINVSAAASLEVSIEWTE